MKIGDKLTRLLAGIVPMEVIVGEITETEFKVSSGDGIIPVEHGWTFDRKTGAEIDHDLHWGPMYGITGSYIKDYKPD